MATFIDVDDSIRLIKKYPNRRLYDTSSSAYITLLDIKQLVMAGERFAVIDVKTNKDISRSVLLQILLEEESTNAPMFSTASLAHIIRYYDSAVHELMAHNLEQTITSFIARHPFTEPN